jgi:hypothetical protein
MGGGVRTDVGVGVSENDGMEWCGLMRDACRGGKTRRVDDGGGGVWSLSFSRLLPRRKNELGVISHRLCIQIRTDERVVDDEAVWRS